MIDRKSVILLRESCEDVDCIFNLEESCQRIEHLLYGNSIGGIPAPLTCSAAVHEFIGNDYPFIKD